MKLSGLLPLIRSTSALSTALAALERGGPPRLLLGVSDGAKAATVAALAQELSSPILVLAARPDRARALVEELVVWLGDEARVHLFPERDPLPYERLAPDPEAVRGRLSALALLSAPADERAPIVVASGQAVAQRTLSPQAHAEAVVTLSADSPLEPEPFLRRLALLGYRFLPLVDEAGQASRRGGIIDVFPPTSDMPLRIELLGNRVESLRLFDPASQRSVSPVDTLAIGPAREVLLPPPGLEELRERLDFGGCPPEVADRFQEELSTLAAAASFSGDAFYVPFLAQGTLFDFLPAEAVVVCDEPSDLAAALDELEAQAQEVRAELEGKGELPTGLPLPHLAWRELAPYLDDHRRRIDLSRWASGEGDDVLRPPFLPAPAYGGRLRTVISEALAGLRQGKSFVIVSQQASRLSDLLGEDGVAVTPSAEVVAPIEPGGLAIVQGSLPAGWRLAADAHDPSGLSPSGRSLTLLTDTEIFGFTKQRRALPRRGIDRQAFLAELAPGDHVVHVEHGIARFVGLVRLTFDGHEREYLELHYAEGDKLFVPTDQLDRVSRYVGPGDHTPSLTRLGSQEWARTKARVRRAVGELARELLALYASREVTPGRAFPPDTPWQTELEASFPYVETPDQVLAIHQVKEDMETPRPMDRLVCGDVGYGKTEVAIRAAFKAVLDGMQVAVLVPTTVLAQQHFRTFSERLAGFPLRIEVLSRFRSEGEQRQVVADLAAGAVDVVIGTHRLIQKDVQFKNLGLVIIDEEQRFGVAHKERLKQMRQEVDVLTLSATPIPRTLYMALGGVRDMSTMETPPEERLPIKTYVLQFDERLIREAILRELDRGGQVYFVHNRVQTIDYVARRLREIVPEAEIAVAHGQMAESAPGGLEQVMLDFVSGRIDVLACTTIIESGLDIPNVNTIIIHQADRLGLAQLYQLRGRVGRGASLAYAYLIYDRKARLTEAAQKRLQAIFEATELGAGFQIALRDLEIRGAGNILGPEQSGQMAAVGFELYCRLLAEAVERLRAVMQGQALPTPSEGAEVTIDLPLSAHLPESYVPDLNLRLALYQRMAQMDSLSQVDELAQELTDRFQAPPPLARNLLYVVRLRVLALQAGVQSIATEDGQIVVRLKEGLQLAADALRDRLPEGVGLGRTSLRLERARLGPAWPQALQRVLEELAGAGARSGG